MLVYAIFIVYMHIRTYQSSTVRKLAIGKCVYIYLSTHITHIYILLHILRTYISYYTYYAHIYLITHITHRHILYGVSTVSRIDKIIGLFCRISSLFYTAFLQKRLIIVSILLTKATPYYILYIHILRMLANGQLPTVTVISRDRA